MIGRGSDKKLSGNVGGTKIIVTSLQSIAMISSFSTCVCVRVTVNVTINVCLVFFNVFSLRVRKRGERNLLNGRHKMFSNPKRLLNGF